MEAAIAVGALYRAIAATRVFSFFCFIITLIMGISSSILVMARLNVKTLKGFGQPEFSSRLPQPIISQIRAKRVELQSPFSENRSPTENSNCYQKLVQNEPVCIYIIPIFGLCFVFMSGVHKTCQQPISY